MIPTDDTHFENDTHYDTHTTTLLYQQTVCAGAQYMHDAVTSKYGVVGNFLGGMTMRAGWRR